MEAAVSENVRKIFEEKYCYMLYICCRSVAWNSEVHIVNNEKLKPYLKG